MNNSFWKWNLIFILIELEEYGVVPILNRNSDTQPMIQPIFPNNHKPNIEFIIGYICAAE